jgi:hypothetical protein
MRVLRPEVGETAPKSLKTRARARVSLEGGGTLEMLSGWEASGTANSTSESTSMATVTVVGGGMRRGGGEEAEELLVTVMGEADMRRYC